jgi:hypothetical protein
MFEFIREKKKILLIVLLLLVIPPFVVMGAWDRINPNSEPIVATVNDINITKRQWESVHQNWIDSIRERVGGNVSAEIFNTVETRVATLENIINKQIIASITADSRITVSKEEVKEIIRSIPEFQKNGIFNLEKAQELLIKRGMTTSDFENRIRFDIASSIIPSILAESSFVPRSVARKVAQAENEKRTFKIKLFSPLDYKNRITVSDEEVEGYFNLNKARFVLPSLYNFDFIIFKDSSRADSLANRLYEESDSLDPVAQEFDIKIEKVVSLDLNTPVIDKNLSKEILDTLNNPLFRKAVASTEVLEDGLNSELVEINPNLFISANLSSKTDEIPMKFDLVKSQIKSEVLLRKMNDEAKNNATQLLDKYNETGNLSDLNLGKNKLVKVVLKQNEPDIDIGKFTNVLSNHFQELFSHNLEINNAQLIDIGRNGAVIAVFINSSILKTSDPIVVESLSAVYENMQRIESDSSLRFWLSSKEEQMEVVRYQNQLESSSINNE